jgi:hypothetical protein
MSARRNGHELWARYTYRWGKLSDDGDGDMRMRMMMMMMMGEDDDG